MTLILRLFVWLFCRMLQKQTDREVARWLGNWDQDFPPLPAWVH